MLLTAICNIAARRTVFDPNVYSYYPSVSKLSASLYELGDFHVRLLVGSLYWRCRPIERGIVDRNFIMYFKFDAVEYNHVAWVAVDSSGVNGYAHRLAANVWHTLKVVNGATKKYYVNNTIVLSTVKDCAPMFSANGSVRNVWIDTGEGDSGKPLPDGYEWY